MQVGFGLSDDKHETNITYVVEKQTGDRFIRQTDIVQYIHNCAKEQRNPDARLALSQVATAVALMPSK